MCENCIRRLRVEEVRGELEEALRLSQAQAAVLYKLNLKSSEESRLTRHIRAALEKLDQVQDGHQLDENKQEYLQAGLTQIKDIVLELKDALTVDVEVTNDAAEETIARPSA